RRGFSPKSVSGISRPLQLSMSGETCDAVHQAIERLTNMTKIDGKRHDFTIGMTEHGAGICFHCNPAPSQEAIRTLEVHCAKRKYTHQTPEWYGVSVGVNGEIQFGITLNFPWEKSIPLDDLTREMKPSSSVRQGLKAMERLFAPKKHGRNDACPCGSGLKYKKCCL
ncbi:SEC-C metal-binding domain-containing protein, partial [Pseudomonas aeruginosa]